MRQWCKITYGVCGIERERRAKRGASAKKFCWLPDTAPADTAARAQNLNPQNLENGPTKIFFVRDEL